MRRELNTIAERYGDARRTEILADEGRFPLPSGDAEQEMHLFLTHQGYLKALPARNADNDGGLAAAETLEAARDDFVTRFWLSKSEDQILAFTRDGQVNATRIGDVPQGTRASRGRRVRELMGLAEDPVAVHTVRDFAQDRYIVAATRKGRVKRTALSEYRNIRGGGIIAVGLEKSDEVVDVHITNGSDQLVLATQRGQLIRFDESEVRPMGRAAAGVKGIQLARGDRVTAFVVPRRDAQLLGVTATGLARTLGIDELRMQSRGGKGVHFVPPRLQAGPLVGFVDLLPGDRVVATTESGEVVALEPAYDDNGRRAGKPLKLPIGTRKLAGIARAAIGRAPRAAEPQMSLQI